MRRYLGRRRAPVAALLLLVHTACYSYVPLQPAPAGAPDSGSAASESSDGSAAASSEAASRAAELGLEGLQQGTSLRVHLSEPGSYPLTALTPNNVTVIDGNLIRTDDSSLYVSAYWMKTAGVQEFKGNGETATIPLDKIDLVEGKKVSAGKTAAVTAVLVGVVALLGVTFGTGSSEGGSNGGPPQPN
jgi:hypothetical protein